MWWINRLPFGSRCYRSGWLEWSANRAVSGSAGSIATDIVPRVGQLGPWVLPTQSTLFRSSLKRISDRIHGWLPERACWLRRLASNLDIGHGSSVRTSCLRGIGAIVPCIVAVLTWLYLTDRSNFCSWETSHKRRTLCKVLISRQ